EVIPGSRRGDIVVLEHLLVVEEHVPSVDIGRHRVYVVVVSDKIEQLLWVSVLHIHVGINRGNRLHAIGLHVAIYQFRPAVYLEGIGWIVALHTGLEYCLSLVPTAARNRSVHDFYVWIQLLVQVEY